MGAKTWMLVLAESNAREALAAKPALDREATRKFASAVFPKDKLEPIGNGNLADTCPPPDQLDIGCFAGVSIIAATEFGVDFPSKLPERFIALGGDGVVTLHAMHSVVDWFAYAIWDKGKLVRSLSVSLERGVMEDIGQRMPFELPFWSGEQPILDGDEVDHSFPVPFHPLEFGEAALKAQFGYTLEGEIDPSLLEPESIPLLRFKRIRTPWWKFW